MTFAEFKRILASDLFRYGGEAGVVRGIKVYRSEPGFKYTFWWRLGEYFHASRYCRYWLYPLVKVVHSRLSFYLGISIPIGTKIGKGLYIGHYGGIVISGKVTIGKYCNLSQGVTVGQTNRGRFAGVPVIGDCVYMGPGSTIVGGIKVGDRVLVAANSLVTNNIESDSVCIGVPAQVRSMAGSGGYVEFVDDPAVHTSTTTNMKTCG